MAGLYNLLKKNHLENTECSEIDVVGVFQYKMYYIKNLFEYKSNHILKIEDKMLKSLNSIPEISAGNPFVIMLKSNLDYNIVVNIPSFNKYIDEIINLIDKIHHMDTNDKALLYFTGKIKSRAPLSHGLFECEIKSGNLLISHIVEIDENRFCSTLELRTAEIPLEKLFSKSIEMDEKFSLLMGKKSK